ncbi:MAG: YabP/YqfC family sporulation protein [Oscillospiraceae bacterium]|nr:YabP/YqfC family sporulation protein [Oscillospiraceae bacterium]
MKKSVDLHKLIPATLQSNLPVAEITGNREITIEGSTGVLKYESDNIKVNTKAMVLSVSGRNLKLKYLSSSSLIIGGTILSLEFIV